MYSYNDQPTIDFFVLLNKLGIKTACFQVFEEYSTTTDTPLLSHPKFRKTYYLSGRKLVRT